MTFASLRLFLAAALGGILAACAAGAPAPSPSSAGLLPGDENRVSIPGVAGTVAVFLPDAHPADRLWPVVYFLPGTDMPADTKPVRQFAGEDHFVIVSLPDTADGGHAPGEAGDALAREHARFRTVRQWVETHCAADPARACLGGFSRGGWQAVRLADLELPRLAGLVILAAGRLHDMGSARTDPAIRGRRVYIGVGEQDANLAASCRAREYYARQGAAVTFEVFSGLGHSLPEPAGARRLVNWFLAGGRYVTAPQSERDALRAAYARQYTNSVLGAVAPLDRFQMLHRMVDDPLLAACGEPVVDGLRAKLATLGQAPEAVAEWQAELRFRDLMRRYSNLRGLDDLEAVATGLAALRDASPGTRYGQLAARVAAPVMASYTQSAEATRLANAAAAAGATNTPRRTVLTPKFPGDSRHRAPVPIRDGNRVTFK